MGNVVSISSKFISFPELAVLSPRGRLFRSRGHVSRNRATLSEYCIFSLILPFLLYCLLYHDEYIDDDILIDEFAYDDYRREYYPERMLGHS